VHSSTGREHVSEVCGRAARDARGAAIDCSNVEDNVVRAKAPASAGLNSIIFTTIAFVYATITVNITHTRHILLAGREEYWSK